MADDRMDLVYRVLDEQLIDADGRRCGRVDDVEFDGRFGAPAYLSTIMAGSGTWWRRLPRPLRRLAKQALHSRIQGEGVTRVPWSEVDDMGAAISLRSRARELGLGQGDERRQPAMERLPGA